MAFTIGLSARARRATKVIVFGAAAAAIAVLLPSQLTAASAATPAPYKGLAGCADDGRLKTSWWYDWYINPGSCNGVGEFVPMVSGKGKHGVGDIQWQRDQVVNAGYKTFLGFNEPDHADQANMSVATAVSLWPTVTANLDSSYRIGGPAPASDGRSWFNEFMSQVQAKNLRVDFLTMHWYGWSAGDCDADATHLEAQIKWMEGFPGNRPIWITEFGCMNASSPNATTVNAFYQGAVTMLAKHPRVERYAFYPWLTNNALTDSSGLTELGTSFANAPASRKDVTLVNRSSGKCLDVAGASKVDGANVQQWTCNGGTNQRWRIEALADGTNRLINVGSGKALDVAGCGTADGTNIRQWAWSDNACQRWSLSNTDSGWLRLINPNSGKVADLADCGSADGTNVRLWSWLNNACQQWQVRG